MDNETLKQAYADFLTTKSWDDFFTITFRQPRKEPYYAMQSAWHELEKNGATRAFMGVEPHQSGDLHIHGIVSGESVPLVSGNSFPNRLNYPDILWSNLFKRFGRSKVESINDGGAVTSYCSKYILKARDALIDHYGFFGEKHNWR